MANITYLLSTGRVSTQNVVNTIEESAFKGVVEHEPLAARYKPRLALRNSSICEDIIEEDASIKSKMDEIERLSQNNEKYVSIGWTTFGWADYFLDRWKDKVKFVGLFRQPYKFAASKLTHGYFLGRDDLYTQFAIVNPDANIHYKELASEYETYSPFEKLIFHWLETNKYILDFCKSSGSKFYKFEELYGENGKYQEFYYHLCDVKIDTLSSNKDKYNRGLKEYDDFRVKQSLKAACRTLCLEMGYSAEFIDKAEEDVTKLAEVYSNKRIAKTIGKPPAHYRKLIQDLRQKAREAKSDLVSVASAQENIDFNLDFQSLISDIEKDLENEIEHVSNIIETANSKAQESEVSLSQSIDDKEFYKTLVSQLGDLRKVGISFAKDLCVKSLNNQPSFYKKSLQSIRAEVIDVIQKKPTVTSKEFKSLAKSSLKKIAEFEASLKEDLNNLQDAHGKLEKSDKRTDENKTLFENQSQIIKDLQNDVDDLINKSQKQSTKLNAHLL